jgi:hypothetical protein
MGTLPYDASAGYDQLTTGYDGASMAFGIDYSAARYDGALLKSRGVTFVCRYLRNAPSGTIDKALTLAEANNLRAAGLSIISNDETTGKQVNGGYTGGQNDAKAADAAHRAAGGPSTRPIYFSPWDSNPDLLTSAQWGLLWDYLDGVASVIGRNRVGLYGGLDMITKAFDRKAITFGWQTYGWSGGVWDSRAQIQQYLNGQWSGQVDYDRSTTADFGQWGGQLVLDQTDITNIAVAVGKMFRISPDSPMTIVQYGQASNVQAFTILAQRLADLKTQLTGVAEAVGALSDDESKILAAITAAATDPAILSAAVVQALQAQGVTFNTTIDDAQLQADFRAAIQGLVFAPQPPPPTP